MKFLIDNSIFENSITKVHFIEIKVQFFFFFENAVSGVFRVFEYFYAFYILNDSYF